MITVTENAVKHLRDLLSKKDDSENAGLRLFVGRGGCAGLQYSMKIGTPESGDEIVNAGGVKIIIDRESSPFLKNSEVDYVDTLSDSGFKINNPNAARSCGCGSSFEPADTAPPASGQLPAGTICASDTPDKQ